MVGVYVDNTTQVALNPISNPYSQEWMLWKFLSQTTQVVDSGISTTPSVEGHFDIRTRRKLKANNDTLILLLAASGNATLVNYAFQQNTLLRLP
jgi:hypothetical protein